MWIKRLASFKKETERKYREGILAQMEPWKKRVMDLHERSSFLFYFEEIKEWDEECMECRILGELAKGNLPEKSKLYLYSGEGECLGTAILLSTPEEKEEKRIGVFRTKKNECSIQILCEKEEDSDKTRVIRDLAMRLSILSELSPKNLMQGDSLSGI